MKARLLSLIVAITLVIGTFGTVGFAATFSDVESTKSYSSAVSLLSALKLLKGYEDGTFKPDGDITRAEFATVVVRALGQEESAVSAVGKTNFDDVAADFWASGYINVASTLGIVNGFGDGRFGPEENVTYEQAVKMVVCALGYEALAISKVDNPALVWPAGYLNAAAQLNMLTGVSGTEGVAAKRWQVARLVYNSLEIDIMEKVILDGEDKYIIRNGRTLLNDKLSIYNSFGEFIANSMATATESGRTRSGEVKIYDNNLKDEVIFKDGGIDTKGMVGHSIKFYYTETADGDKTLVYIEDKTSSSEVLKIDASDIEKVSGTLSNGIKISYWGDKKKDSKTQTASIDADPIIMINGIIVDNDKIKISDLQPLSGSLELIDSNRSGNFDKVLVTSYETYAVKSANVSNKTIIDTYRKSNQDSSLEIDEDNPQIDVTIKRADGSAATLSNISQWNVLSVKRSESTSGRNTMEVIISNKSVSGTVTSVDDETNISIEGKEYEVSPYFIKYAIGNGDVEAFEVDDSGKFYLDKDGKIAAFDKTASASSNYGFLIAAENTGRLGSNNLQLKILPQTGGNSITYNGASKIKIDGVSYSADEVINKLTGIVETRKDINSDNALLSEQISKGYVSQLVKYTLSANQISSIQTIDKEITVMDLYSDITEDKPKKMKYNSNDKRFTSADGKKAFNINSSTHVFVVPTDRKTNEYKKADISCFLYGRSYCVEAYDTTGKDNLALAKVVVLYEDQDKEVNATSPIAFITDIKQITSDKDPNYNRQVFAYEFGKDKYGSSPVPLWAEESAVSGLQVGDVIRYTTTYDGYIVTESVKRVLDVHGAMELVDNKEAPPEGEYYYQVHNGLLFKVVDGFIQLAYATTIDDIDSAKIEPIAYRDEDIRVFLYDESKSKIEDKLQDLKKADDAFDLTGLIQYDDYKEAVEKAADEIFVYKYNRKTKVVYIIKRSK